MDPEVKKEVISRLKWFLSRPMFMWLFLMMLLLWVEVFFEDHPQYPFITLGFAIGYVFCMMMFMRGMNKATIENMRYFEEKQMEFVSESIRKGAGSVLYIFEGRPEGVFRKLRMKFLGMKYLVPYAATFVDTGTVHQKAHITIPVTKRQMFQLKLMGCYETKNRERAVKALEYLGVEWPLP